MNKKNYFWISILLALVIAGIFTWKNGGKESMELSSDIRGIKADLILYGVLYKRDTREMPSKWIIHANVARFFEHERHVDFEHIFVTFFRRDGEPVKVKADAGRYDMDKGRLAASGNVTVKGIGDYTIFTERLFYTPDKKTIEAPDKVRLIGEKDNSLVGKNMIYFIDSRKILLDSPEVVINEDTET